MKLSALHLRFLEVINEADSRATLYRNTLSKSLLSVSDHAREAHQ